MPEKKEIIKSEKEKQEDKPKPVEPFYSIDEYLNTKEPLSRAERYHYKNKFGDGGLRTIKEWDLIIIIS